MSRALLAVFALCAAPLLAQQVTTLEAPKGELVKVIIRTREAKTADAIERAGARVERRFTRLIRGVSVTVRRSDLDAIRALPGVASVREDVRVYATLAQSVPATRADRVWQQFGTRGAGRTVAIIDTGIDFHHEAFGGGFGPGHRIAGGWDFVNDDADPDDDNGHGTHVAGIVGANGGGLTGVAPDVTLLAYKVLDREGSGDESNVIAALERAADPNGDGDLSDHVDVVNLSLGAPAIEGDPLIEAVDNAVAAGIVVVASSGNSGTFYSVGTPGVAASALTVGAVDRDNALANFSSRGPTAHQLLAKPEILAPGVAIVSAKNGGGTTAKTGTSMAAPHVAGIAALVRAIHPDWTPAEVKSAIVSTAIPVEGEVVATGAGRVDALAAAEATLFTAPTVLSFGVTSGLPQQWTSTLTLAVTNRSAKTANASLTISGERAGVDVVAPMDLTIPPNETQVLPVRVHVDNALVPAPTRGSLTFGGTIRLHVGTKEIRVPWMFVKAATITIQWDSSGEYGGILTGSDYVHSFASEVAGPTKFFVPSQDFDLAIASANGDGTDSLLLFEKQAAAGNPVIHASREMAKNTIVTGIVDQHGTRITPVPREDGEGPSITTKCGQHLVFRLPGRATDTIRYETEARRIRISDVVSTKLLLFENCGVPEASAVYTVDRNVPLPLDRDYVLTNDPSEYVSTPIRVAKPQPFEEGYGIFGSGVTVRTSGGGFGFGLVHVRSHADGPYWDGTLFMTQPADPKVVSAVSSGIAPGGQQGGAILDTPVLRVEGNRIVTARGLTDAPDEFSAEAGETIVFGDGPIYPTSLTAATATSFTSFHEWRGLLGEYYRREITNPHLELFDEAGTLLRSTDYLCCAPVAPGFYKVVATGELRTAHGSLDRSTVITTVDTRRDDTVPPSLNTVRILDGDGRVTRRLSDRGAFVFSLEDTKLNESDENPWITMPPDRVTFAWRRHGSAVWLSATPVLTADDQGTFDVLGHPPTGVHYRVDLAEAIAAHGPIDVKISFADAAGNTTEWIGESVFSSGGGKRRTMRR